MSDADRPAYRRAHREKERGDGAGPIDGGAIAVGLMGMVVAFMAITGLRPGPFVGALVLASGAAVGGYLTARAMAEDADCVVCHTAAMVVIATVLAGLIGTAVHWADPEELSFVFVAWDRWIQLGTFAFALVVAGIGGWIGAARKP